LAFFAGGAPRSDPSGPRRRSQVPAAQTGPPSERLVGEAPESIGALGGWGGGGGPGRGQSRPGPGFRPQCSRGPEMRGTERAFGTEGIPGASGTANQRGRLPGRGGLSARLPKANLLGPRRGSTGASRGGGGGGRGAAQRGARWLHRGPPRGGGGGGGGGPRPMFWGRGAPENFCVAGTSACSEPQVFFLSPRGGHASFCRPGGGPRNPGSSSSIRLLGGSAERFPAPPRFPGFFFFSKGPVRIPRGIFFQGGAKGGLLTAVSPHYGPPVFSRRRFNRVPAGGGTPDSDTSAGPAQIPSPRQKFFFLGAGGTRSGSPRPR